MTPIRFFWRLLVCALLATTLGVSGPFPGFTGSRSVAAVPASPHPVRARHGMVASTSEIASQIGGDVLKRGGNAVDAAIAVSLALAVTYPSAGNLGGGGFMLVRMADGRTTALDYRETAPAQARATMYQDAQGNVIPKLSSIGHLAVGVPGTVAGMDLALKKFGTRKWADLVEPARRVAAEGFPVGYGLMTSLRREQKLLERFPETKRIYLGNGRFLQEGEIFRQPELAATLTRLRDQGPREFYEGKTAQLLVAEVKRGGGLITLEDLKNYQPVEREPLRGTYRGYDLITMPPPSSGGIALLEMLNMLELHKPDPAQAGSSEFLHLMAEIMRRAFADRAEFPGDPDFVKVPVAGLISKKYAQERAASIDLKRASTSKTVLFGNPVPYESQETTHFTIIDKDGNVVSNTYTLNGAFGSGVTVAGAGFLLNNEMDDFAAKENAPNDYDLIQGKANAIAPHKRPLSSMTPTIVLKDGKVVLAIGSPGGPTIINTVFQVIVNVLDFKMNIQEAIDAPRIHHQWLPDEIRREPKGFSLDVVRALEARGHHWREKPENMGDAQGIMIEPETGMRLGASDPRNFGKAVGY
ncbi:MAG: gamma-glutamyltransferase [Blastocatellia bacterium]|nr:gamma-glutamyltransferase [Blastocatellia bacterium]